MHPYRKLTLQTQTATASASEQKLDAARLRCSQLENQKRNIESAIQHIEVALAAGTLERGQTKELQANQLEETKRGLDAVTSELQSCRVVETEAATRVRADQAKLSDIQDRIDRLEKELEKLGTVGK